jgi:aspartyl-tRNA(Asn)/glutamyl-tRNA(Gln) amidotransferase subunit C
MITTDDIKKVAHLSRLGLTDKEVESATKDVGNILSHFAAIQAIDTTSATATDDASGLKNISRPDEVSQLGNPADLIAAAPQTHQAQIKVSAVFEE